MIRSPFPDIEIPDMPFTEFVLERAGERGDKAAIIDGPTGRTITYPELVESVQRAGRGPGRARLRQGRRVRPLRPEPARVRGRVSRSGDGGRREHDRESDADRGRACQAAGGLGREAARDRARAAREGERGRAALAGRGDLRVRRGRRRDAVRIPGATGRRAAPGRDRSRQRPDRAAVLERHHRASQGRDAHAPKPGREHRPVHAPRCHAQERRRAGGRARDRRAPVLSHLRARRIDEHPAVPWRDGRDDAALRPGSVPAHDPALPRQPGMGGAADRPRAGQASARRRVRRVEPRVRELWRRAAVRRARSGVRRATRLSHAAGLRAHRDEPDHALDDRQARGHDAGLDRPRRPQHRVPDRRRRHRAGRRDRRARGALHPRPAGDEGLPQQSRGDRPRDRRRRLVPLAATSLASTRTARSGSSTGSRS